MYFFMDPAWAVDELSYWPADEPQENDDIGYEHVPAAWRLDLCRDGTLSRRKRGQKAFNGVAIPVYYHEDEDVLKDVQNLMCTLAYGIDKRLTHEGGKRFIFSWAPITGTLWQLWAVQRVIHSYIAEDASAAYAEGQRLLAIAEEAAREIEEKTEAKA